MDGPVDGVQQQVLAGGEALASFGDDAIDQVHQADGSGQVVEGGDIAEAGDIDGLGLGRLLAALDGGHDTFQRAEIDGADDAGFAVDAAALAGVVVGASLDDFGGQAGHAGGLRPWMVRSYHNRDWMSRGIVSMLSQVIIG